MWLYFPNHVWRKILGGVGEGVKGKMEGMKGSHRRGSVISCFLSHLDDTLLVLRLLTPFWSPTVLKCYPPMALKLLCINLT